LACKSSLTTVRNRSVEYSSKSEEAKNKEGVTSAAIQEAATAIQEEAKAYSSLSLSSSSLDRVL
jgi:hypothetical protein